MSSFFSRVRAGLAKTAQQIRERLTEITAGTADAPARTARVASLAEIEDALIGADVGVAATRRILASIPQGEAGPAVRDRVAAEITAVLTAADAPVTPAGVPRVILIVGVNGTGKTTSVGKLANLLKQQGQSVMVCAADTFRAAAVEQLAVWTGRAGVDLIRAQSGADPASVVHDAAVAAKVRGRDVLLVDTAGRLHTKSNLMAELEKIRRVVSREIPGAPHDVLLVLDATVGQNGLVQAREFMAAGGVNGLVLTKLDGTAKGGIAVAIAHELKLPIRYIGVGEGIDDLVPFDPEDYVHALFAEQW